MTPDAVLPDQGLGASVKGVVLAADDTLEVRRQKRARIILDAMYQFLGLLDVNGIVLEINRAALEGAGICLDDVVGRPFWEARWWAVSEESRDRVREMVEQAKLGQFVRCDVEVYGDLQGKKTIFVDFSLTPIRDDAGRVAFLLPEGRNITEKIAMEAELTRKNEELQLALERLREIDGFKTKFFANVSHELRTPLALILGPVDQLLREPGLQGERERFRLEAIKRNAQALLQQVNDLLDLARIDAQQMPLAYVCANVSALLRDLVADFAAAAEERGIALVVDAPDELYADIDRAKFSRVVANLLSNAFKFAPKGGRIVCSIGRVSSDRFLLSVQDNGAGVPAELRQQIFSRFAQGQQGLADGGSGLGLNIVKEFVELHLGTVVVLDAPGGGAVFQVEMPLRAPAGSYVRQNREDARTALPAVVHTAEPVKHELPSHRAGHPNVLVVEDNADLRHFLYDVLIDDYNVTLAANGNLALTAALGHPPDLVITDLMMPECEGEPFLRRLREIDGFQNVPAIVLSARADDTLRETLLNELAQDYLTKPFSPLELRARIRNLVAVKRTVDLLQKELNSRASNICELTASLVASRKSLQEGMLALQISERRWQGLYENTQVGIALADREGRILKANPALQRMLGYDEEEIVGVSFVAITEESQRAMTRRTVYGLFDGVVGNYQAHKRYEKRGGGYLWANVSASLIPAIDRDGPRLAVIVEDVSAEKKAESELATAQADLARVARFTAMGELVASIAHEVNQPLSAIVTNGQAALRWLDRTPPDLREVAAALTRVNRDAVLAGEVIARIRNFLRKGEPKREPINVRVLVDDLLKMLRTRLVDAEITAHLEIPEGLPAIEADPIQLQQVLMNLLLNAIEALRDCRSAKKTVTISIAREANQALAFSVQDNGPGIPAEVAEHIFDALFSTKADGMGMGLAISRSIVEGHGGQLRLVSQNNGGAHFQFSLPFQQ